MNKTQIAKIEKQINAHLASLPAGQRPESEINGQRIQSVAYSANGYFEASTTNGHAEYVSSEAAKEWLK